MTRREYQREAVACVRLAEQTDDPTTKMVSVGLAQAWLQLAQLAENDEHAKGADQTRAPSRENAFGASP
jgi:hypothetical protein